MPSKDIAEKTITFSFRTLFISISGAVTGISFLVGSFWQFAKKDVQTNSRITALSDSIYVYRIRLDYDRATKLIIFSNRIDKLKEQQDVDHLVLNKVLDVQNDLQKLVDEKFYNKK